MCLLKLGIKITGSGTRLPKSHRIGYVTVTPPPFGPCLFDCEETMTDFRSLEPELRPIVQAYQSKQLTRRDFMKKALAAGLSVSAAASLLAACAPTPPTTTTK